MPSSRAEIVNKYELRVHKIDNRLILTLNGNHTLYNETLGSSPKLPYIQDITSLVNRGVNHLHATGINDEGGGFNPYDFIYQVAEIQPGGKTESFKINIHATSLPNSAPAGTPLDRDHPFEVY